MKVFKAIQERRSIRKYKEQEIEEDKLKRILEAGRLAPSAKNMQEWRFVIVREEGLKERLQVAANNQPFVSKADTIIIGCGIETEYVMRCGQLAYPIDVAIAMTQISLQAVEEGCGTCWVGSFYEAKVKSILNIPDDVRIVQMMTLGYPDENPETRPRLDFNEIFMFNEWNV